MKTTFKREITKLTVPCSTPRVSLQFPEMKASYSRPRISRIEFISFPSLPNLPFHIYVYGNQKQIERSGESECGRRSDLVLAGLFTTSNFYIPWVQWERDDNGNSQMTSGGVSNIQNVYWNVSMSSHSPQSITIYDHIAITFNQLSTEHKNLESQNLVVVRK